MEINNIYVSYDINRKSPPCRVSVTHVNDVNTRVIELKLTQDGETLEIGAACTVKAALVGRFTKQLICDNIVCSVTGEGNILIPIDNLHFRNKMDINVEVSISDQSNSKLLTLPYPLWIRVNPSVLDDAEVTEESLGTVPELLEEAKELIENYHYVPTREELEQVAELVDVSGKEDVSHKQESISNRSQTSDSVNYPNINAVRNYVNYVKDNLESYIDDEIDSIPQVTVDSALSQSSMNPVQNRVVTSKFSEITAGKADKSTTLSGYGITNAYTKSEVDTAIETAIGGIENGSY